MADDHGIEPTKRREKIITLRLDPEVYAAAVKKMSPYGVSTVLRALLKTYLRGDLKLSADDLMRELVTAPKRPRKPAKK